MARILVIDDQPELREVVQCILEEYGHEVNLAADGRTGTELFHTGSYDLVITDLLMPEQDGLETLKAIREINPAVKIIAMSGAGNFMVRTNLEKMTDSGADLSLTKPFSQGEIVNAVEHLLGSTPTPA